MMTEKEAPVFARILVPIDGSEESWLATKVARHLIDAEDAVQVTLLHVLSPQATGSFVPGGPEHVILAISQKTEERSQQAETLLEEARRSFQGCRATVRCEVLVGHPARVILDYAKQQCFDLIVIGAQGLTGITEFLLGEVTDPVVHHAPCSVLVVRPKKSE